MGRPVSPEVRLLIAKLRAAGMTRQAVARKFGVTVGTVTKIIKQDSVHTKTEGDGGTGGMIPKT